MDKEKVVNLNKDKMYAATLLLLGYIGAKDFIDRYYRSPGFIERFERKDWMNEAPQYVDESGNVETEDLSMYFENPANSRLYTSNGRIGNIDLVTYTLAPKVDIDTIILNEAPGNGFAWYSHPERTMGSEDLGDLHDVYDKTGLQLYNNEYAYWPIFLHELGHAIEGNVIPTFYTDKFPYGIITGDTYYTARIPILRLNSAFQRLVDENDPEGHPDLHKGFIRDFTNYSGEHNIVDHDARPTESYADLILFRGMLDRYGIYDSTKANNPFTLEHLNKFEALGLNCRLLWYFTPRQIVWMMNNIAYNPTTDKDSDTINIHSHNKDTYA